MRALKVALVGMLALLAALVIVLFVFEPMTWQWRVRKGSVSILRAAQSTNELRDAVGYLGIFIPQQNGSWIAIRYRDTHAGRVESLAIARDSGGGWFESTNHFCGTFLIYQREQAREEALRVELSRIGEPDAGNISSNRSERMRILDEMHAATSLDDGRKGLLKLGMVPLKP